MQTPSGNGYNYGASSQPPFPPIGLPPKDPSTGLLLELIGLFGFSGIGWLWAGQTVLGIVLLIGFWSFIVIEVLLMYVLIGFCQLPFNLAVPLISGLLLQKHLKGRQDMLAAQQYPAQPYAGQQYPF